MLLRDAIAMRSLSVNRNQDELLAEFEMIEEALQPLKKEIEKCKEDANVSSVRTAFTFTGIIFAQYCLTQYGTWYAFNWDVIEPITACISLSDAIAGYLFWLWAGQPWDVNAVRSFFFNRRLQKLFKKKHINY